MLKVILVAALTQAATLFHSLDPTSVTQQLAYHQLYPGTKEGAKALDRAQTLLGTTHIPDPNLLLRLTQESDYLLTDDELAYIDRLATHLPNRRLKGHTASTIAEVAALDDSQVDLTRGLLLTLFDDERAMRSFEARVDLMALQILARTTLDSPAAEKIAHINRLLFVEIGLRFPPHSAYSEDIDLYTFLPSVLDARRGVCLGVSTLYLCLGQRLNLDLEAVTPPGHIYVRSGPINIETTARGIHIPDEHYLGIETATLQTHTIKEVIGLNHMNRGAALWQHGETKEAITAYRTALTFLPNEPLAKEFLGYNLLLNGDIKQGRALLAQAIPNHPDPSPIEDLLAGKASIESIQAIYCHTDETRESILAKQTKIKQNLEKHPNFRAGWFHLAITYIQLGRHTEALTALQTHHTIDATNPTVAYYLAELFASRHDYNNAWHHLAQAEALTPHNPKPLRTLRRTLRTHCPE